MLIGIISDSHGHHEMVRAAVERFDRLDVKHIVHCGDVGGQAVFDELVGRRLTFVWGNTDFGQRDLEPYLQGVGIELPVEIPTRITLDGKRCAVYHGHERGFVDSPFSLEVDYIFHGHTHVPRDESINGVRVVNPGALCRANPKSIATLDTATDELIFHDVG